MFSLIVNGKPREVDVAPDTPLAEQQGMRRGRGIAAHESFFDSYPLLRRLPFETAELRSA